MFAGLIKRLIAARVARLVSASALFGCLLFGATPARARQAERAPARGIQPTGAYSVGDVETINLSNGNLMLNIPLGALPAGRGGNSGLTVGLHYDSKLWDAVGVKRTDGMSDENGNTAYTMETLQASGAGGWRYTGGAYTLTLTDRFQLEPEAPCDPVNFQRSAYRWKLKLTLPDGSVHDLIPPGQSYYQDGFYNVHPDGVQWTASTQAHQNGVNLLCSTQTSVATTGPLTYITADGSRLRLVVEHGNAGVANPWTLYFPDGRVATSKRPRPDGSCALVCTYGRNGDYVEYRENYLMPDGTLATGYFDLFGRSVRFERNDTLNEEYVITRGIGGEELRTTIHWRDIAVRRRYTATSALNAPGDMRVQEAGGYLSVVDRITLPAQAGGLSYVFDYNGAATMPPNGGLTDGWGELKAVTLPSGARAEYQFLADAYGEAATSFDVVQNTVTRKTLTYLRENDGGQSQATETWEYAVGGGSGCVTGPDGGSSCELMYGVETNLSWQKGLSYRSLHADGSVTERDWRVDPHGNTYVKREYHSVRDAGGALSLTKVTDFDYDQNGNLTRGAEYDWVAYGTLRPPTGPPTALPPGQPVRVTTNKYYAPTADAGAAADTGPNLYGRSSAPRLLGAVASTEVTDGAGDVKARTEFAYDDPLTTGNLTAQMSWDSTKGPLLGTAASAVRLGDGNSVSARREYDDNTPDPALRRGNVTLSVDANGNRTKYTYGPVTRPDGSAVAALYPTTVVAAEGTSVGRTSSSVYDFSTGLVTKITDEDNQVSTSTIYDALGRPTLVEEADGEVDANNVSLERRTVTVYSDALRRVIVRSDLDATGDGKLVSVQHYDQLGRVRLSRTLEDASTQSATDEADGIKVQARYMFSGQGSYGLVSNPYRAATSSATGGEETMGWAVTTSDRGGRVLRAETFGGASLPAPFATAGANTNSTGVVVTAYDAEKVTVTDPAGKQRRSVSDAMGRLARVFEAPNAADYNYETSYTYDALGNLKQVVQGAQTRTFNYSSLSRLTSAQNPEGGLIQYQYDANGNLVLKIDPRPRPGSLTIPNCPIQYAGSQVATCYDYDPLGRVKSRSYNDGTPDVSYAYDASGAGTKGRLSSVSSSVSTYSYTAYDALGRVTGSSQTTDGITYVMPAYKYNLAGGLVSQQYPSGRVVETAYDAAGRMAGAKSQATGLYYAGAAAGSPDRMRYAAGGAATAVKLGNGLWENTSFNSRLQPTRISLGTVADDSSVLRLDYAYGVVAGGALDTSKNNGNIQGQTITVPGVGAPIVQTYLYDEVNRLKSAEEKAGTASTWKQVFTYDQYGNRNFAAGTNSPDYSQAATDQATGLPVDAVRNPAFDPLTNRVRATAAGQGDYRYDEAGNLLCEPGRQCVQGTALTPYYAYDAENKMKTAAGGFEGGGTTYTYDGDGRRVKKARYNGEVTVFVYDTLGRVVAEYSNQVQYNGTRYLTQDHLGSTRVVTDAQGNAHSNNGASGSRHDYFPFGEEIGAGVGGRTTNQGYSQSDGVRQKFTGYERDNESDLDFAQARMYNFQHGRFTAVDPYNIIFEKEDADKEKEGEGQKLFTRYLLQPQNWNRYVYVWNNPLRNIDPTGEDVYVVMYTTGNTRGDDELRRAAETQAEIIKKDAKFDPKKDTVLIMGVRTKEDVQHVFDIAKIMEYGERGAPGYGKVQQVQIFSHSDANGPYLHPPGTGNEPNGVQWTVNEVKNLKINWASGGTAYFNGCYSAGFAQTFANAQNVTAYGNDRFAYFSSDPNKRVRLGSTGPAYLFATDGYENGTYLKYLRGNSERYPMVRKDPSRRR